MQNITLMLPVDSTKIDEHIKPFWSKLSTAIHCVLWQPHQIVLPEQDLLSSNGSLNYQVAELSFWKSQTQAKILTQTPLSLSLPASLTPIMEKEVQIVSEKIRIYPKSEHLWFETLNLYRRAYNLTVEQFNKYRKPSSEFRSQICDWCRLECEENGQKYNANLIQAAYRSACKTRQAVVKQRVKGKKSKIKFLSRNSPMQYFIAPRLSPKKQIFPQILGGCDWSENPKDNAIGKEVVINYVNNQWFACVKSQRVLEKKRLNNLKMVALDPGVRTFQTSYSENESNDYGAGFVENKLVPLMARLDRLLSAKDLLKALPDQRQWVLERLKNITHQIHKIRIKQKNLVDDLHQRVAHDLVKNYDVILLPEFKTKQMVQKSNEDKKRFIRKKTVRSMLGLAHFKFKQVLKWFAKKQGKTVVDVNESYTSKTLWDGSLLKNLGGKSSISFQNKKVRRDVHGARNIFIRYLTKVIEFLSPKEACSLNITQTTFCGFSVLK